MEANRIRAQARRNLAGSWGLSMGVALVASLLGGLTVGTSFLPEVTEELENIFPFLHRIVTSPKWAWTIGRFTISLRNGLTGLAAFFLGGTFQLGYASFLLSQHDGKEIAFRDLFSCFNRWTAGFAQRFLRNLYVFLWSLLLVIPGIIKSYSYAMTPFILTDNPDFTAIQAIDRSVEMMDGHKMELFTLSLTFLGWDLLAALTLNLGHIVLNPYKNAAYAAFYRQLQTENRYTSYL